MAATPDTFWIVTCGHGGTIGRDIPLNANTLHSFVRLCFAGRPFIDLIAFACRYTTLTQLARRPA
jgi:hypothetical protein